MSDTGIFNRLKIWVQAGSGDGWSSFTLFKGDADEILYRVKELEEQLEIAYSSHGKSLIANCDKNKRIKNIEDAVRQIKILNAGKDSDINWLCEKAGEK